MKNNNNIPTNQANFLCQVEQKFHHQLQEYIQNIKIETILHRKKRVVTTFQPTKLSSCVKLN